jgi:hypothetical protein
MLDLSAKNTWTSLPFATRQAFTLLPMLPKIADAYFSALEYPSAAANLP